jgi:hypothetical protein
MIDHPTRDNAMAFRLEEAVQVLERTPGVLRAMLGGLTEAWMMNNYGPETWGPFDVVGHLIHGEKTDWIPRARIILERGPSRAFEPFDRYAQYEASRGKTIDQLLDEFESLRRQSLEALRGMKLTDAQLDLPGTHPALGAVTLRNLLATWVCHDLNHIHQIAKSMAFQYRNEVGAWREYITILPRQ